ncbi:L-histidine N(alpha)-methyltransferase [Ectothiorhodospiraceae bacterium 2226]|nr:L-histidine N(alpha)-methyltransferase [Ectothiorhodospiraceae bacterium 2226]
MRAPRVHFYNHRPAPARLEQEVLAGLAARSKAIPPKFFYDARGSALFDAICEQPEYYPTRTEIAILRRHAGEMAGLMGPNALLIELGSGSSQKVRLLLEALQPAAYMPLDISEQHLLRAAHALAEDYPWLEVHAACVDYSSSLTLPPCPPGARRVAFFPGSSLGNFEPDQAQAFLKRVADAVRPDGGLLIGIDLKKDARVLDRAYNDAEGVTAAFNLNLLARINRELGADFDLDGFEHCAFYNAARGRVEMHLVSRRDQQVRMAGRTVRFAAGEHIHTENSYKYSVAEFQALARGAGFAPVQVWTDPQGLFSVHYLQTAAG